MNSSNFDYLVEDYLSRLDAALRRLAPSRRQQLLAEIKQHLDESRAQLRQESEADIRDLLERVGEPEDIAAEAMADAGPGKRRPSLRVILGLVAVIVAVIVAAAIAIPLAVTSGGPPNIGSQTSTTTATTISAVVVPSVVGESQAAASQILLSIGLVVHPSSLPSTIVPAGSVASQDPPPGSKVASGSAVILVVSAGPPASFSSTGAAK